MVKISTYPPGAGTMSGPDGPAGVAALPEGGSGATVGNSKGFEGVAGASVGNSKTDGGPAAK